MRVRLLVLSIFLSWVSQAPVVVAGTRGVVEEPAQFGEELCRGWDGNWFRRGARECLSPETTEQAPAPTESAGTHEATHAAQASEGSGSQNQFLFLLPVLAAIAVAAVAIAATLRVSRRASTSDAEPEAQPADTSAQSQPDRPEMGPAAPPIASEDLSAAPVQGESDDVQGQPARAEGEARLVTVWTGTPCTVEFTWKDQEGDWHRNTVDINRIMRDPRHGGWHLRGFCHLWREERDFDGASIVTKILYKSRRWDLEDWITAVTRNEARGS
jgi:hypothetical protein